MTYCCWHVRDTWRSCFHLWSFGKSSLEFLLECEFFISIGPSKKTWKFCSLFKRGCELRSNNVLKMKKTIGSFHIKSHVCRRVCYEGINLTFWKFKACFYSFMMYYIYRVAYCLNLIESSSHILELSFLLFFLTYCNFRFEDESYKVGEDDMISFANKKTKMNINSTFKKKSSWWMNWKHWRRYWSFREWSKT